MDMDMSTTDSSAETMSDMEMVFFTSTTTPLFSKTFSPLSTGGYAGTCIFLIVLAIMTRLLWASKTVLEQRQLDRDRRRRYIVVRDETSESQNVLDSNDSKDGTLITGRGLEEKVRIMATSVRPVTAWRFSVDLPRAILTTVITGLAYLLMLAVMTMNVGYFLSVIAGVFIGDLAVGRYGGPGEH